jgi:hypothetical protein
LLDDNEAANAALIDSTALYYFHAALLFIQRGYSSSVAIHPAWLFIQRGYSSSVAIHPA